MNRLYRFLTACVVCSVAACGSDAADDKVTITLFQAAPDAIQLGQSTKLLFVVTPPDAQVAITGFGDFTGQSSAVVSPTATTTYHLTATKGTSTATNDVTVTVGAQNAVGIKLEPASTTPTAGQPVAVTVTATIGNGKPAPGFRGTVHLASTDAKAVLPADIVFTAADAGVKQVMVTLKAAGLSTLTGTETTNPATQGSASMTVQPGAGSVYELTTLPATAKAGEALVLTITVRDAFGNIATGYAGQAQLTATDPKAILPAIGGFTAGIRTVSLAFTKTGTQTATAAEVGGAITAVASTGVNVGPGAPFQITVSAANPTTTAGTAEGFTATLFDFFGNVCTDYLGTVHFASTDASAVVPGDFAFTAGDAGAHTFSTTLKTAGTQTLALSDTVAAGVTGANAWTVGAAAAASCAANQAPVSAVAGSVFGVAIVVHDAFGNLATGYAGTVSLTATDARAILPSNVTFVPAADAGSHAFSAQLITTGAQIVTATDIADATIHCDAAIAVSPGAPKITLAVPGNANAGFAVSVAVTVKDLFDNAIPNFAGTVSFTSSDTGTGAVAPAPITFTGGEGGIGATSTTFVTLGTQTITASNGGTPAAIGSAATAVHGLVYTAPTSGRVRLVANAAQSNARVVQLDLVANERLEVSSFFGGGPGSFAAGMNLPLDTTRADADTVLFTPGAALPAGPGPRAAVGRIGATDHVLYTAVSRKRVAGTNFNQETEVQAGQVFYSVRLKLLQAATIGPVFDGAQPSTLFRAAVRDQYGDDFVSQGDFGLGKLEVR
jgi:hypothetical protein